VLNIEFICPTEAENTILGELDNAYTKVSEMSFDERAFLNALILRNTPKKLLEIGVSSGGSSIVILNAIKNIPDAKLYSVDLNDNWYRDSGKKTGYFVDNYQQLKPKWKLLTGALTLKFIEQIGGGIDFCLIDTWHYNPGEIFDILMVLPYLTDDAIIIFHDVKLHTTWRTRAGITNNLLMSSITGRKLLQGDTQRIFPNIAGIKTNAKTKENIYEIFNLLTIQWSYFPADSQEKEIVSFFKRHYDEYYAKYIVDVFAYQRELMKHDKKRKLKEIIKKVLGYKNIKLIKKLLMRT
jgi:predicted O-methyltransferase YrrM